VADVRGAGWLFALCASFVLVVGCEQAAPVEEVLTVTGVERLGFVVSGRFDNPEYDMVTIGFSCADLPDPLPAIVVADSFIAPGSVRAGVSWSLAKHRTGEYVPYRIAWKGDTLADTLRIPHRIDSVFCNGHFLSMGGYQTSRLPIAEQLSFRWSCAEMPYYSVWGRYWLTDTSDRDVKYFDTVLTQPSFVLPVQRDGSRIRSMSLLVGTSLVPSSDVLDTLPPLRSEHLYCRNHLVNGPRYWFEFVLIDSL